jgi:hypothetical protein
VNGQAIKGMPAELESDVVWFSEIEPVEVDWLWPTRIPAGRITLLVGLPGKGKSLVTVDMAARVSTGTNLAGRIRMPARIRGSDHGRGQSERYDPTSSRCGRCGCQQGWPAFDDQTRWNRWKIRRDAVHTD